MARPTTSETWAEPEVWRGIVRARGTIAVWWSGHSELKNNATFHGFLWSQKQMSSG